MYVTSEMNEAISFLRTANSYLKNVRINSRAEVGCSCCCASHGGGKAKYEEKNTSNNNLKNK